MVMLCVIILFSSPLTDAAPSNMQNKSTVQGLISYDGHKWWQETVPSPKWCLHYDKWYSKVMSVQYLPHVDLTSLTAALL